MSDEPLSYPFLKWCKRVGISPATGHNWRKEGKLSVVKLGKLAFVTREESDRILRDGFEMRCANGKPGQSGNSNRANSTSPQSLKVVASRDA